ncbi:MAG: glycosyltransferase family 2 protein [Bellilinea sp.]
MNSAFPESSPSIAVVIPAYRVEREIAQVIQTVPASIKHIIVMDDASPDQTGEVVTRLQAEEHRLVYIRHDSNQGVGGAMVTGYSKALELGADIIVKMDGDGQMNPNAIHSLIDPLLSGKADYTKGNRFRDTVALRQMPAVRRFGNTMLGFLAKAATGYWNIFDPTNGFVAIRAEVLAQLPLEKIDRTFYFETSMLAQLYLIDAVVQDVSMPARYGDQKSNLRIAQVMIDFPPRLLGTLVKRMILKHLVYDFSMISIYLMTGMPLLLFGLIFGMVKWIKYASLGTPAPTGTVILPMMCVLLGIQFLLSAVQIDLQSVPRTPLSSSL